MVTSTSEPADSSILVILDHAEWAGTVLRWAGHEADRRHSGLRVVDPPDRSAPAPAATAGVDMILTGPLERSRLSDLVFNRAGAVSGCPIVVVPDRACATGPPVAERAMLTVGFHGSGSSEAALAWAVMEATRRGASVQAVLAWLEGPYGGLCGAVPIDPHVHALAGRGAQELAATTVAGTGLAVEHLEPVPRRGHPSHVLVKEAAGSELLVIGAGGCRVHQRRVLGPVVLACTAYSPVPVAIVGTGAEPGRLEQEHRAISDQARSRLSA